MNIKRTTTITALMLLASASAAAQNMLRVDYVHSRILGETMIQREEGTHVFSMQGYQRIDRQTGDERTTEIFIPAINAVETAERIEINHTLGTVRRGPAALMSRSVGLERQLSTTRALPGTSSPEERRPAPPAATAQRMPREVFLEQFVGEEGLGPLILRHYRVEFPNFTRDSWRYELPIGEITLAVVSEGTLPDGTHAIERKEIVGATRVPFDIGQFTEPIPPGMRVHNLWERPE